MKFYILLAEIIVCVIAFAIIYYILSKQNVVHFRNNSNYVTEHEIDSIDAVYFSLVTQSTVGFGSIVPVSRLSKLCVSLQVFSTLMFVVRWATMRMQINT